MIIELHSDDINNNNNIQDVIKFSHGFHLFSTGKLCKYSYSAIPITLIFYFMNTNSYS